MKEKEIKQRNKRMQWQSKKNKKTIIKEMKKRKVGGKSEIGDNNGKDDNAIV